MAATARVFAWNGSEWVRRGSDLVGLSSTQFGQSVSMSDAGDAVIVGVPKDDSAGEHAGKARVYYWNGAVWIRRGSDIYGEAEGDNCGVVSMSGDGNSVAVGSPESSSDGLHSGQIRVFDWDGTDWAKRGDSIGGGGNWVGLGKAVAMSFDGNTVVTEGDGLVRVFDWGEGLWSLRGEPISSDEEFDNFGSAVAVSDGGDIVAVGAYGSRTNGNSSGLTQVFVWDGVAWIRRGAFLAGEAAGASSGYSVALSGDGSRLAVGEPEWNNFNFGQARVYEFSPPSGDAPAISLYANGNFIGNGARPSDEIGTDFGESVGRAKTYFISNCGASPLNLTGDPIVGIRGSDSFTVARQPDSRVVDPTGGLSSFDVEFLPLVPGHHVATVVIANDSGEAIFEFTVRGAANFVRRGDSLAGDESGGYSIAANQDASVVAMGGGTSGAGSWKFGHARVFGWDGARWSQKGSEIVGLSSDSETGYAVSMDSSGDRLVVGSPGGSYCYSRAYQWDGGGWVQWGEDIDCDAIGDRSGSALSMSSDGNIIAIGSPYSYRVGARAGLARVFYWGGSGWVLRGSPIEGEAAGDEFGASIAISADGGVVAIGAPFNDSGGEDSGNIRVFSWQEGDWVQRGDSLTGAKAKDRTGSAIQLSDDGSVLIEGAPGTPPTPDGAARVFVWDGGGWEQRGSTLGGGDYYSGFGKSVGIDGDGDSVVVAATAKVFGGRSEGRTVWVYDWDGSDWLQRHAGLDIPSALPAVLDRSGRSVVVGQPTLARGGLYEAGDIDAGYLFQSATDAAGLSGVGAQPLGIPLSDGIPNLLKYAFNLDLGVAGGARMGAGGTSGLPSIVGQGEGAGRVLRFEFVRRKGSGLAYLPMKGDSLGPGNWMPLSSDPAITPIDPFWERVVYEEPAAGASAWFGVVGVTLP